MVAIQKVIGRLTPMVFRRTPSTRMDTMNQNPNTTKQAEGGHSRAAAGSDYECGDEVTIEGHGTRTVNAQIGEYLFLDTDTDGPFIDAVHVSFVQNDQALPQTERPKL